MKLDRKLVFFLALLVLGLMLSAQFKSTINARKKSSTVIEVSRQYREQLELERAKNAELLKKVVESQELLDVRMRELAETLAADSEYQEYMDELMKEIEKTRLLAGLTDVRGRGVIVTIDDAPYAEVKNIEELLVHDSDLIRILNELKKAGAQAISINEERIINTSEVICAGPNVRVNKNRYPRPFVVKAIGDPDRLYRELSESAVVSVLVSIYGIRIDIRKSDDILVPGYRWEEKYPLASGLGGES